MVTKSELTRVADNIRILSAAMVEKAKSGHPGGAMGGADFMAVLYTEFLRYDPDQMDYPFRDRFFLDPGHMSPMLYSTLALAGTYTVEDLRNLRQWGSVTPGHPEVDVLHGVENTSGPLGQGHAMALGAAIAERFLAARFGEWQSHKTYAYISDGGIEEEVSQGVGRIAGHLGMNNLIMYYDSNNVQLSTKVDEVDTENVAMKYEAWGWNVITIDGHDVEQIREALTAANAEKERPTLIIGRTVMGKGAVAADGSSFEDKVSTHGQPLTAAGADFAATVRNLGGDAEDPFKIFSESGKVFDARREELREWVRTQREREKTWRSEHKELSRKLDLFLSGKVPEMDYKGLEIKPDGATRAASASVLSFYAERIENMIVASADLCNSDKTDGYLKKTKAFSKGDFRASFPGRRFGADDGLHRQRYGAAWGRDSGVRYVLRLLGLYETRRASGCPDAPACNLYLDARLVPCGRGRSDAPARRARGSDPSDGTFEESPGGAFYVGAASGRRRGNRYSLEIGDRGASSRRADPVAAKY